MGVKEHYDHYLGRFYSWMAGDFDQKQNEFGQFLLDNGLLPVKNGVALDLGAGHGIQSISLAKLGFKVSAIDFNGQLLAELRSRLHEDEVTIIHDDFANVSGYSKPAPELILCWGDTILHLDHKRKIDQLIRDCFELLLPGGKLVLSFRDYSAMQRGASRFIPVKRDNDRMMTCLLECGKEHIAVKDMFYERRNGIWEFRASEYHKARVLPAEMRGIIEQSGFKVISEQVFSNMVVLIAMKP